MLTSASAAPAAATLPLFLPQAPPDKVSGLIHAATLLAQLLGQGRALDSRALRSAMEAAFGASDAEGAWVWKDAYEALEAAQVLFLRKFGAAMRSRAGSAAAMLEMLTRLAERLPSQTRRSEESERLQQFSTPIALGFVASEAAALTATDLVLEPSAGTGLLSIFAELARARLVLNEIAETRAGLLARLFRDAAPVTRHNAEQIHDRLDPAIRPGVVLMNPPFSASPHIEGRFAEAAIRHVAAALARLADGGRLVAVTGRNVGPDQPAWRDSFVRLREKGRVVFSAALAGQAYARHGTTIETRLTVIDRVPAGDPRSFPPSPGMAVTAAELLDWIVRLVPPRAPVTGASPPPPPPCFRCGRQAPRARNLPRRSSISSNAPRRCRTSSRSLTRRVSGPRAHPRVSPQASMRATRCRRSTSRAPRRTRPSSCSRRPWPRSPRRAPPTGRTCRRAFCPPPFSRTRSVRASSMPARLIPVI
jgi:predicted RNA methylase